jgi:hypothetical protein
VTKTAYYFPHDYNARTDPKLQAVMVRHGITGIGAYWCIVEQLYEQGGVLAVDSIPVMAFALHADEALIRSIVVDFGLFVIDEEKFYSPSANRRLDERKKVSDARRDAVNKRWKKSDNEPKSNENDDDNENSEKCNCIEKKYNCNTIKEKEKKRNKKKVKESKVKNNPPTPLNSPKGDTASAPATAAEGGGGGQAALSFNQASPGFYYYQKVNRVDLHAMLSPYVTDYDRHRSEVERITCCGYPENMATTELENWAKWQAYAAGGGTMDVRIKSFDATLSALRRHAENGGIPGVLTYSTWQDIEFLDTIDMDPDNLAFVRETALASHANLLAFTLAVRRAKGKSVKSPAGIIHRAMKKQIENQ